jgi:hypothetical protein
MSPMVTADGHVGGIPRQAQPDLALVEPLGNDPQLRDEW